MNVYYVILRPRQRYTLNQKNKYIINYLSNGSSQVYQDCGNGIESRIAKIKLSA